MRGKKSVSQFLFGMERIYDGAQGEKICQKNKLEKAKEEISRHARLGHENSAQGSP